MICRFALYCFLYALASYTHRSFSHLVSNLALCYSFSIFFLLFSFLLAFGPFSLSLVLFSSLFFSFFLCIIFSFKHTHLEQMLTLKVIGYQMSNSSSPSPYPETPTDLPLPETIGSSEILSDNHRRYVSTIAKLPRGECERVKGYSNVHFCS